ncbi:cytokine receptor-like, partial [Limulus polyphemus]|uniref:Cytokine receptor-like n=1 Tax=Limulus polyphemus TaxID=6850 RepID=A0ABM1RZI1_LIMPO
PLNVTTDDQDASKIDIQNLKPFTLYRVTVQVISRAGISDFSDPKYEKTFPGTPSVPRKVMVMDVNSSAIQLTWKVPAKTNGVISHYFVYYRNFLEKVIAIPAEETYSVALWQGVKSYTNYSISVTACNDKLCSSPSVTVYGMTCIDAPGVMMEPYVVDV